MLRELAIGVLAFVSGACASGGSASDGAAPAPAPGCPLPANVVGYPVSASTEGTPGLAVAYLEAFARAAAYRWVVPSRMRPSFTGWERVRRRTHPPEPRWADDWRPDRRHRAEMVVTLHRDGRVTDPRVRTATGDPLFDRSLQSIVDLPMPGAPEFPPAPPLASDSVPIVLRFGEAQPAPASGVVRFAMQARPPVPVDRSLVVRYTTTTTTRGGAPPRTSTRPPRTVVKYDVDAQGLLVPGTLERLEGTDADFARAIETALRQARFSPATSNCRPIQLTVVQVFGS